MFSTVAYFLFAVLCRGPIWLPVNYLVLDALHHYGMHLPANNPLRTRCNNIYIELRRNLIVNVITREYNKRTGMVWEQYSDKDGKGQRGHPFTGWSALMVSIIYELFDE